MEKLKIEEIKDWDLKKIDSKVEDLRKMLFDFRMQKGVMSLEKPHLVKDVKKSIARLLTVRRSL